MVMLCSPLSDHHRGHYGPSYYVEKERQPVPLVLLRSCQVSNHWIFTDSPLVHPMVLKKYCCQMLLRLCMDANRWIKRQRDGSPLIAHSNWISIICHDRELDKPCGTQSMDQLLVHHRSGGELGLKWASFSFVFGLIRLLGLGLLY